MNVRGAGVRSLLLAIEKTHGREGVARLKAAVPADVREQLDHILPVQWYPIAVSAAMHVAVRDVFGAGKWDHSHALGVVASQIDFTGLYRLYLRAVQYDTIWDRAERAWSNYNSQGEARWVDRTTTSASGEIRGVTGYNLGLWHSVAGRAEGLLRMAGVASATVQLVDGTTTHASFSAIWIP